MEMTMNYADGIGVIGIAGELDAHTSPELTLFFEEQIRDDSPNFVADLKGLSYSSSAGIRIFLGMAREARRKGGDLRIAAIQPQVDKIFKLSKFDRIVKTFPTVDEAIESYQATS